MKEVSRKEKLSSYQQGQWFSGPRAVALKFQCPSESPGGLLKQTENLPRISDSVVLGWGLRSCISFSS